MLGKLIPAVVAFALQMGAAMAQPLHPLPQHPAALDWPGEDWPVGTLPASTEAEIRATIGRAIDRDITDEMGETRAVVIIHKGRLVAEAYREGFGPETKQVSWSMAKSVTHALVGRLVQLELIDNIDAPMPSPWSEDDPRAAITWRQWLTMTDGLDYTEIGATDLAENDVIQMMFGPGRFDVIDYVQDLPLVHELGTHWNYSTAGLHMVSRALVQSLLHPTGKPKNGPKDISIEVSFTGPYEESSFDRCLREETYALIYARLRFPDNDTVKRSDIESHADFRRCLGRFSFDSFLFNPLGMDATTEYDAAGTFLGGSLVWASARDFARFGYLYLRDGVWEGERLLPEGWVDFARTETPGANANVYGAGWWLTPPEGVESSHPGQTAKTCPCDAFSAQGHEGQTIWVVPSKDLVIVRLGLMSNGGSNWPALYEWNQAIARAFPDVD